MTGPRLVSRMLYAAGRLRDLARGKPPPADGQRGAERLGRPSRARPQGCLLWTHARLPSEAGAALAVAQELAKLRGEPVHTLITTAEDGPLPASVAAAALHQLAPGETSGSVQRFLGHWRPDLALYIDAPDRPRLIAAARAAKIPLFLADSRRSTPRSRQRMSYLSASLLENFDALFTASAAEADVLRRHLGNDTRIEVTGPLTDTAYALPCDEDRHHGLTQLLAGRPVWLAARISPRELDAVEAAHRQAFRSAHRLLLVIALRDPADGAEIAASLADRNWHVARDSEGGTADPDTQILLADEGDDLGLWYRLAPIALIGGTLAGEDPAADPYEAAALGSAVVHGPHLGTAPARFQRLREAGASYALASEAELGEAIVALLAPDRAASLAHAAWSVMTQSAPVIERLAEAMDRALDSREET